jgi:hypothetical protein
VRLRGSSTLLSCLCDPGNKANAMPEAWHSPYGCMALFWVTYSGVYVTDPLVVSVQDFISWAESSGWSLTDFSPWSLMWHLECSLLSRASTVANARTKVLCNNWILL